MKFISTKLSAFFLVWILGFFKKYFYANFFSFKDSWFILVEWTDSVSLLGIFYFIIKFNFLPIMMYVWQKRMFERRKKTVTTIHKRNMMFFSGKLIWNDENFVFRIESLVEKKSHTQTPDFFKDFVFSKQKKKENYENFLYKFLSWIESELKNKKDFSPKPIIQSFNWVQSLEIIKKTFFFFDWYRSSILYF